MGVQIILLMDDLTKVICENKVWRKQLVERGNIGFQHGCFKPFFNAFYLLHLRWIHCFPFERIRI